MSDPRNKVTGANEFIKEKQAFLDFINQDPIPTAEEVVKFTRNMPPRLVKEIKYIMNLDCSAPRTARAESKDKI